MKKIVIAIALLTLVGCGRIETIASSVESYAGLLERTVTLYNANGEVIKTWKTNNEISYVGPVAAFIDKDGVNVRISGTFVIEGK